jgi:hypothetical protein
MRRDLTKLVLVLAVVSIAFIPAAPAHAQGGWTDSGSIVHLTTNSDRVGIGTTTPGAKLHVAGGMRVDGALSTNFVSSRGGADLVLRLDGVNVLRLEQATGSPNIIGGHTSNEVFEGVHGATISGGGAPGPASFPTANVVTDHYGTIGGGRGNQAGNAAGLRGDASIATVSGGSENRAEGLGSTVGGGLSNVASGFLSIIGGGQFNEASGYSSTVGGGWSNVATASFEGGYSTVGGGALNVASGDFSTVPGGNRGKATHTGSFVWADATDLDFNSLADNQFRARSTGGAQFVSAVNDAGVATAGVTLAAGGGSWASISDRSVKENIASVDGGDILRRLSAIPITRWNLKAQNPEIKHVGPMAQDFYAAFGLGEDERYINSADVDGIALVSIQALYQMVTALEQKTAAVDRKAAELERMAAGLDELRARLTRFERAAELR